MSLTSYRRHYAYYSCNITTLASMMAIMVSTVVVITVGVSIVRKTSIRIIVVNSYYHYYKCITITAKGILLGIALLLCLLSVLFLLLLSASLLLLIVVVIIVILVSS